jgi:hypothetical protein
MTSVPPFEVDSDMLARLGGVVFKVPPRRAVGCQFKSLNGNTGTNICDNCFLIPRSCSATSSGESAYRFFHWLTLA